MSLMSPQEYVREMSKVVGGIDELVANSPPCAKDCSAHPSNMRVQALNARAHMLTAEFTSNGLGQAIADKTSATVEKCMGEIMEKLENHSRQVATQLKAEVDATAAELKSSEKKKLAPFLPEMTPSTIRAIIIVASMALMQVMQSCDRGSRNEAPSKSIASNEQMLHKLITAMNTASNAADKVCQ
jgi:hypothetical protein